MNREDRHKRAHKSRSASKKITACKHPEVECLNHYEYFRKYRCVNCGQVLMCDCEKRLAKTFLPHQVGYAHEYGTNARIPVNGFASKICAECRGQKEVPHPKAAIWGVKGKIERFYWREIFKTHCELTLDHYAGKFPYRDVTEHAATHPELSKQLKRRAKQHWQEVHRKVPKYDTQERTEAEFLASVEVPIHEIEAPYKQVKRDNQRIGKWLDEKRNLCSAEDLVAQMYQEQGFVVLRSERQLPSIWIATFLGNAIQDSTDPKLRTVMRGSTVGWRSDSRDTPMITFSLPEDFGSVQYFERRREAISVWLSKMREVADLHAWYEQLLPETELIRDYLWAAEEETVVLGRNGLQALPRDIVELAVSWTIKDFWNRQSGWPDLLISKPGEYKFSEVKTPHDKLSQDQMNWFEWAVTEAQIRCEIMRVKRLK